MTSAVRAGEAERLLREWAAGDAEAGPPGFRLFFETARALADLGCVDRGVSEDLTRILFKTGKLRGSPLPVSERKSAEASRKVIRTVAIGSTFGERWPEHLYAIALDIFDDHMELSVIGDPHTSGSTMEIHLRRALDDALLSLRLVDDCGTTYNTAAGSGRGPHSPWFEATYGFAPAPPPSATLLRAFDGTDQLCLQIELAELSGPRPLVGTPRRVTAEAAVRNMLLDSLAAIEGSLFTGRADTLESVRETAENAVILAKRLVEVGVLPADHRILHELSELASADDHEITDHVQVAIEDPRYDHEHVPRLLRVIPLGVRIGPLNGRYLELHWLAILSDRLVLFVTDLHGIDNGYGSDDLRWRVSDGRRWRRGAYSWRNWCGWGWAAFPLNVRGSVAAGARQLTLAVDAHGVEIALTVPVKSSKTRT